MDFTQLDSLLSRKLSRKQFLSFAGLGLISLTSLAKIFKMLNLSNSKNTNTGYGHTAYGGSAEKSKLG